jgi:DNA primase
VSQIDDVKSRLDIVEIISGYLQLKPAGTNFRACCPFHQEKTPSFMVSKEKQIWHCFGCGEGGDVFKFVMKMEGMEFPDTLKMLAEKAGVKLEKFARNSAEDAQKSNLLKICDEASKFFHKNLLENAGADEPRKYLSKRGIRHEVAGEFKIGFAPREWDLLVQYLSRLGFREEDIFQAGLALKRKSGNGHIDRFRGRIMIPISDINGNVCGFTGRLLPSEEKKPDAGGKYMNSPQSLVYDKGRILFFLNRAKQAIKEADSVVVVEGNMDAITCHQFGFKNTVASSGTALTTDQLRLIKRFTKNLFLAFDADLAGETAAKRGIDNALKEEMEIKVIEIPEGAGKDPDDCIRKNPELWKKAITDAKNIMDYYFEKSIKKYGAGTLAGRQKIRTALFVEISRLNDGVARSHWLKKLSEILNVRESDLYEEFKNYKEPAVTRYAPSIAVLVKPKAKPRAERLSEQLLAILIANPKEMLKVASFVVPEMIPGKAGELYQFFLSCYNEKGILDYQILKECLTNSDEEINNLFRSIVMLAERDYKSREFELYKKDFDGILEELRVFFIKSERENLEKEMLKAEKAGDKLLIAELSKKFNELI